jgi:Arc/MetJ-type ribon-helix-helix transcriptional regulator
MTDGESKKSEEEKTNEKNKDDHQYKSVLGEFGESVGKFATQTMESIKKSIDKALISRNTVLTIRVNDDANKKLGMLVETGIFKSRSESAAFLIEEGIKHQEALFKKISKKLEQIAKIKEELTGIMSEELGSENESTKKESKKKN